MTDKRQEFLLEDILEDFDNGMLCGTCMRGMQQAKAKPRRAKSQDSWPFLVLLLPAAFLLDSALGFGFRFNYHSQKVSQDP